MLNIIFPLVKNNQIDSIPPTMAPLSKQKSRIKNQLKKTKNKLTLASTAASKNKLESLIQKLEWKLENMQVYIFNNLNLAHMVPYTFYFHLKKVFSRMYKLMYKLAWFECKIFIHADKRTLRLCLIHA